jgi:GT2 family glycosyltransferase
MKWITTCLDSLLASTIHSHIIVVDNASTDGTQQHIQTNYPSVTLIQLPENIGFGRANNTGIDHAFSLATPDNPLEAIFLLNQDAHVAPNTLETLLQTLKSNPEYGILSPIHLNGAGTDLDRPFRNYLLESDIDPNSVVGSELWVIGKSITHNPIPITHNPLPIRFINAAAWLINPACLQKTGGFHPAFFMYGEDWELLNRVNHAEFKVGLVPDTYIFHDRESRPPKSSEQREIDFFEVKTLVSKLHPGLSAWDRLKIIVHELFMTFSARFFTNPVASVRLLWQKLVILASLGKRIQNAGHPPSFDYN